MVRLGGWGGPGAQGRLCYLGSHNMDRPGPLPSEAQAVNNCHRLQCHDIGASGDGRAARRKLMAGLVEDHGRV
jgi:hypothetical protein